MYLRRRATEGGSPTAQRSRDTCRVTLTSNLPRPLALHPWVLSEYISGSRAAGSQKPHSVPPTVAMRAHADLKHILCRLLDRSAAHYRQTVGR